MKQKNNMDKYHGLDIAVNKVVALYLKDSIDKVTLMKTALVVAKGEKFWENLFKDINAVKFDTLTELDRRNVTAFIFQVNQQKDKPEFKLRNAVSIFLEKHWKPKVVTKPKQKPNNKSEIKPSK